MIHKLIKLKNLGKFKNLRIGGDLWNGIFDDTSIIYAQNGSGKTTLSILFQSLLGNDDLIQRKKTFDSTEPVYIKFIDTEKREIKYENEKWNRHFLKMKVFNSHFIENNVYIINLNSIDSNYRVLELVVGEKSVRKIKRIEEIDSIIKKYRSYRKGLRRKKKKSNEERKLEIDDLIEKNIKEAEGLVKERNELERRRYVLSTEFKDKYLEKVNFFLQIFSPSLQITQFQQLRRKMLFGIKVSDYEIRNKEETKYSLKYSLSEGDKNALAFSFFMADVELSPDLNEFFLVIDDPVTSFDYGRKNSTINLLIQLNRKVQKLLILSHDLHFCNDLTRRFNNKCLNLKIVDNGISSTIIPHDIETESMTGIFKDLKILHGYIERGANTDTELREIVRCIRPALERTFRTPH